MNAIRKLISFQPQMIRPQVKAVTAPETLVSCALTAKP